MAALLLVEDNDAIRKVLHRLLTRAGFIVHLAADAQAAGRIHTEHRDRLDIILIDTEAEGFDCREVFQGLRQSNPAVRVIAFGEGKHKPKGAFLFPKPFANPKKFVEVVQAACG